MGTFFSKISSHALGVGIGLLLFAALLQPIFGGWGDINVHDKSVGGQVKGFITELKDAKTGDDANGQTVGGNTAGGTDNNGSTNGTTGGNTGTTGGSTQIVNRPTGGLDPATVAGWCGGDTSRFAQLQEGNGYVNNNGVKLLGGPMLTCNIPKGYTIDVYDTVFEGTMRGPWNGQVSEGSIRMDFTPQG